MTEPLIPRWKIVWIMEEQWHLEGYPTPHWTKRYLLVPKWKMSWWTPASTTSERGSMTVGGLEEEAKVSTSPTEDVAWSQARPEDAITLHAGQSQQNGESDKEAEKREREREFASTFAQRKKISRRPRQTTQEMSSSFLTRCLLSSNIRTD